MDSSWGCISSAPLTQGRRVENLRHLPLECNEPGEVRNPPPDLGPNPFTARLDMKTLEKLDIVVSIVSTCILHDNTEGEILMFCKLWTLWASCLCDGAVPRTPHPPQPPHSQPPEPTVNTKPSSLVIYDIWVAMMPLWTCEIVYFKNGCLLRLCLILLLIFVLLRLCFNAALH